MEEGILFAIVLCYATLQSVDFSLLSISFRYVQGFLLSKNQKYGVRKVGAALKRLAPDAHQARLSNVSRRTNPKPYIAQYFGRKLHVDQNEDLVNYGVTYVMAIDGYSGSMFKFIRNFSLGYTRLSMLLLGYIPLAMNMPIKNCITIYDSFRTCVEKFGLWDQVVVDCGQVSVQVSCGQVSVSK